jgi:hypothetical protein
MVKLPTPEGRPAGVKVDKKQSQGQWRLRQGRGKECKEPSGGGETWSPEGRGVEGSEGRAEAFQKFRHLQR